MKKVKEWLKRPWIIVATIVNIFAVLTLLIYPPFESYVANTDEFWFQLTDISTYLLKWAGFVFVLLEVIALGLPERLRKIVSALVFAGTLTAYLQLNFLNPNYGSLGAEEMDWSVFEGHANVNTIIWIVIVAGVLALTIFVKKRIVEQGVGAISGLLTIMQVASLVVLLINAPSAKSLGQDEVILSRNGIYSLGDEAGSILLFVVDTMDNQYFDSTIEECPELLEIFDGFTRFTDCTGSYSKTNGAVTYMLTGIYNLNQIPASEYADQAFSESALFNQLKENDYDLRCFTGVYPEQLVKYVDNVDNDEYLITDGEPIAKTLLQLAAFRYLPEKIKPYFYTVSGDFNELLADCTTSSEFAIDDAQFYEDLLDERITVADGQKTFRMIHLFGSHAPFELDESVQKSDYATALSQNKAILKILQEYFWQMKEAGVYDNTTIVIVADHGRWRNGDTIFFVKPANSTGGLQYNEKPISHTDLHNTLFDLTGLDLVDYGESAFAPYNETETIERTYYMYDIDLQFEAAPYLPPLWEVVYTEDWRTPHYTGVVYYKGEKLDFSDMTPTIEFGTTYDYNVMRDFFCPDSLTWIDSAGEYIWANLYEATMFLKLKEVPSAGVDVALNLLTWIPTPSTSLRIESNGIVLHDEVYSGTMAESILIHVPAECFNEDNLAVLKWITPDASPTSDHRYQSVGIRDFTVTK